VGLPKHRPEFAVSYPDFVPIDTAHRINEGVTDEEFNERRREVNGQVSLVLESIFGSDNLSHNPPIRQLLRIGLASHLQHLACYDK
jgi:hypothetical protein